MSLSEQDFSNALRVAITAARCGVTLWRQPAGKVRTDRGTWVECAPVGAADLTGVVAPEGWRVELEVKGARTRETPEQVHWRERMTALGCVALTLRLDAGRTLAENASDAAETVRAAIATRRVHAAR
jgi:hypothetical protein